MTLALTKDEAVRLVREYSWAEQVESCGHHGCRDHLADGRRFIHSRRGGFGADNSLESVEAEIASAAEVRWVDSLLGHNLAIVQPDGRYCCVDVPRPVPFRDEELTP